MHACVSKSVSRLSHFSKKAGFDRSIRSKSNVEQTKEYKTHTTILVGARIESEGAISTVVGNMNMSCGHLQIYTRTSKKQRPSKVNQCPYACMFSHKLCVYIYIHINVCIQIHMPFVLGSVFCCIQATITPPTHNTQHRMPFMHKLCSSYIFGSFYHDL